MLSFSYLQGRNFSSRRDVGSITGSIAGLIAAHFLFSTSFVYAQTASNAPSNVLATYGTGFLEQGDGVQVLHLSGSPSEMGAEYGFLAGDQIQGALNLITSIAKTDPEAKHVPNWVVTAARRFAGWVFWHHFPSDVKTEITSMVSGAAQRKPAIVLEQYDIAFLNSLIDLVGILKQQKGLENVIPGRSKSWLAKILGLSWMETNCDSMAVWGPRTVGGKTFQTRNIDVQTGLGLEKFPLVIVFKPDGAIPYVSASFAGMNGIVTGMNAYGVGLGQIWAYSNITRFGTPWQLEIKESFAHATTASQAVQMFEAEGNRTYGSNFVIADANGQGYALETTPDDFVIFTANDPKEKLALYNGVSYGDPMPYAVFRGDVAMDPKVRSEQTASNGPTGDPTTTFSYQSRYKGQGDRILAYEQQGILMGEPEAEAISRQTADPSNNLQASVYSNGDRDLWVSYAMMNDTGPVTQAYQGTYHHIPFADYLNGLAYDPKDGRVHVHSWIPSHENDDLRAWEVVVYRSREVIAYHEGMKIESGDMLELREPGGRLIDRTIVR